VASRAQPVEAMLGAQGAAAPVAAPLLRAAAAAWSAMDTPEARLAWEALAQCATEPNPFHESWYLLPALRGLDPHGAVTLLRVEAAGDLAGLLPLHRQRRYYGRPVPQLSNWVHGNCFLGAPLVAAGLEKQFWRAVLAWADGNAGAGLFLHLAALPLDGPVYAALRDVLTEQGRPGAVVHREERAMLASAQSPQDYFEESLSGKKRKELRRQSARLAELGKVEFARQRGATGLDRWIEQFLALEHSGWKGTAGSALASHQATASLFRESLHGAAARGKLERLTLTLNGEPIAMLVNFLTAPGAYSFKTAFDERYARYSPGVLVQRENLDLLADPTVEWCDSCAAADHPMIDHIWRERRAVGHVSVALGGRVRRALFAAWLKLELKGRPASLA
jgi:CelD/BcsL family acetyltransferase involved in cellulose biosynthesis